MSKLSYKWEKKSGLKWWFLFKFSNFFLFVATFHSDLRVYSSWSCVNFYLTIISFIHPFRSFNFSTKFPFKFSLFHILHIREMVYFLLIYAAMSDRWIYRIFAHFIGFVCNSSHRCHIIVFNSRYHRFHFISYSRFRMHIRFVNVLLVVLAHVMNPFFLF